MSNSAEDKLKSNLGQETLAYQDETLDIKERVEDLLKKLTLKEKIRLMYGHNFYNTNKLKRLAIPPFNTTDGPIGVASHSTLFKKCTRFPTSILVASTWNRQLAYEMGVAMGGETRAVGKQCLLGPGINVQRTPVNGRTFEYLSEDPYHIKEMAIPIVKGIQSQKTAACVKHFAANNQEYRRMSINAIIDERTLNEIYLKPSADVIKESDPWTVMACYNKVNGKHGCENVYLMRDKLFGEFGFKGFVMSDWFASTRCENTVGCVKAGLSLEMPFKRKYKPKILLDLVKKGEISEEDIDFLVRRLLRVRYLVGMFSAHDSLPQCKRNTKEHQELTRKIALEGMVLLKNKKHILPLKPANIKTLCIKGPNSKKKMGRALYGGSSAVSPPYQITPYTGIKKYCKTHGIKLIKKPKDADVVIYCAGLTHAFHQDSEGMDKYSLELPDKQLKDLHKTINKNPNTIMVLVNGSPIAMDSWLNKVPAVLEAWYGGMESGNAIADILFGEHNPSGKLPMTFPKSLLDSPAHQDFESYPGDKDVIYKEGIYVGYRYNDKEQIEALFPYGFGMSYTTFEYSNLHTEVGDEEIIITYSIKNMGKFAGSEISQIYIQYLDSPIEVPIKELKGFDKTYIEAGETQNISINVPLTSLQSYDDSSHKWIQQKGNIILMIGSSSVKILLENKLKI